MINFKPQKAPKPPKTRLDDLNKGDTFFFGGDSDYLYIIIAKANGPLCYANLKSGKMYTVAEDANADVTEVTIEATYEI